MPRPVDNPPNPWSSTHVEWLEEPPSRRRSPSTRRRRASVALRERQPGHRLPLQRQPVPRLPARLRLLLRAPLAPVPGLRRRHRLRSQDRGQDATRPRCCGASSCARRGRASAICFSRQHRLLPAARGQLRAHARAASRCASSSGTRSRIITKGALVAPRRRRCSPSSRGAARASRHPEHRLRRRRALARDDRALREPPRAPLRGDAPARRRRRPHRASLVAPVIPGLNDDQIPELLERARRRGRTRAGR